MRLLIDINHPAHVHLFKGLAVEMQRLGHEVLFTTREKEIAHILLRAYGLPFRCLGPHYKSMTGKLWGIIKYDILVLREAIRFKPDLFISMGSIYASHVAALLRKPNILLQDTENATLQHHLTFPFAHLILNPVCYKPYVGAVQFKYDGYHELAYLHPSRFTPNPEILRSIGINPGDTFTFMRFVSWTANHDLSHQGLTTDNKIKAVHAFEKFGKVLISSEAPLPQELQPYAVRIAPELIHHVMAFAALLYGESATMASECAVLGVPAIFLDNDGRGYTREQEEQFGLVFNFTESLADQERSIACGIEILSGHFPTTQWSQGRDRLLAIKMDVTGFLVWLVEGYPKTIVELRASPMQVQAKFKTA